MGPPPKSRYGSSRPRTFNLPPIEIQFLIEKGDGNPNTGLRALIEDHPEFQRWFGRIESTAHTIMNHIERTDHDHK